MDLYWVLKTVSNNGILVDKVQRKNFKDKLLTELTSKKKELDDRVPRHLCKTNDYKITTAVFRCPDCKVRG